MTGKSRRRLPDADLHSLLTTYKQSRDPRIKDQIVSQFGNLVEGVARRFSGAGEPTEDLVQEGYLGLITAIDGFDAAKGVKFSTYATHFIIGQIKHYLRDRGKIIKEPAWLQELNQRMSRVIEALTQELGRVPTSGEIATLMGTTEAAVEDLLTTREVFKVASLDGGTASDEDSGASYDAERIRSARSAEFEVPLADRLVLEGSLNKLKELEQTVIQAFFYDEKNQTEIARSLSISCNYVSHILRNATRKLRKIMVSDELKEAQIEHQLLARRTDAGLREAGEAVIVDPLTRFYNRQYFEARLEEEVTRAGRYNYNIAVLMVRLSGHARLASAYGTLRSEDTFRTAGHLIRANLRRADVVTRFDPETFALVLPHTGTQHQAVAERLGRILGEWLGEEGLNAGRAPVRVVFGGAAFPEECGAARDLVHQAAMRLEQALNTQAQPMAA
jgi:RNA polymerase sigma-B factor